MSDTYKIFITNKFLIKKMKMICKKNYYKNLI